MPNAVSALQDKAYKGYVEVEEMGLRGMITLRGDLASAKMKKAIKAAAKTAIPAVNSCVLSADTGVAWMSPDELLLLCPYGNAAGTVDILHTHLKGAHFLAADVSDARAVFQLRGNDVREVVAKLAPVDMSVEAFPVGHFRRTRLAQAPAAFFLRDSETVELICFRSIAGYMFDLLKRASMPGSTVDIFN